MSSNALNYAAAIAAIASLVLSFTPYFARYKTYLRHATTFFAGVLVGSVCVSLSAQTTVLQFHWGPTQTLLLGAAVVFAIIVIIAILWFAISG